MAGTRTSSGQVSASRRRALAVAGAVAPVLAGVAPAAAGGPPVGDDRSAGRRRRPLSPVRATEAGWKPVAKAIGRTGRLNGGTVYQFEFPRADLRVVSHGVTLDPDFAIGGDVGFARYRDGRTMVMGDLVVTEGELEKVTGEAAGRRSTATSS